SVIDENTDQSPYSIKGKLIDLFDPEIPVLDKKQVKPGEQALLYNIGSVQNLETPQVLVTAARIYEEKITKNEYAFVAKSPLNTTNVMRVLLPKEATGIVVADATGKQIEVKTS